MKLKRTDNTNALALISSDPVTLEQAMVGFNGPRFELPEDWIYLVPEMDNGMPVGIYAIHPFGKSHWQIHANTLTMFWGTDVTDVASEAIIDWCDENDIWPLMARIPEDQVHVQEHVKRHGFTQVEGSKTLWTLEE